MKKCKKRRKNISIKNSIFKFCLRKSVFYQRFSLSQPSDRNRKQTRLLASTYWKLNFPRESKFVYLRIPYLLVYKIDFDRKKFIKFYR